jgi:membrane-associated protein
MDTIILWVTEHGPMMYLIIFGVLLAAGANLPIPEDVITVLAASAAAVIPELRYGLFAAVIAGAFAGDQISYWIGRLVEPTAKRTVTGRSLYRNAQAKEGRTMYYTKVHLVRSRMNDHGTLLLTLGRVIPFGFRNLLHMTSGFVKLSYRQYLLLDLIGVVMSTGVLFVLVCSIGRVVPSRPLVVAVSLVIYGLLFLTGYAVARHYMGRPEEPEEPEEPKE